MAGFGIPTDKEDNKNAKGGMKAPSTALTKSST